MPEDITPETNATTYTLDGLLARCGDLSEEKVLLFVSRYPRQALVDMGTEVRTGRITTDGVRLLGTSLDFLAKATPAQRKAVRGLTEELVKVAIRALAKGEQLFDERNKARRKKKDSQAELALVAETAREGVLAERNGLVKALTTLAAGDPVWNKRITQAQCTIVLPKDLVKSVTDLASLALQMLDDAAPDMVERRTVMALDASWTAELEELVVASTAFAVSATKAAAATTTSEVSQADVDYWDGINLVLLCLVIDLHEAGHRKDPGVPRLVPIALHKWFGTTAHKPKPAEENPPQA